MKRLLEYMNLQAHRDVAGDYSGQASVLVLLSAEESPSLVLTQRSLNLRQHAGEVAFPGGKWEPQDSGLVDTALRECSEEIGVMPSQVQVLGCLARQYTRQGVSVTPVVAHLKESVDYSLCDTEIASIFHVPLDFFASDPRVRTDYIKRGRQECWVPAFEYEGYEIWGFTSSVIVNLLRNAYGVQFKREHEAPVRVLR